jgi:hypothetical protein
VLGFTATATAAAVAIAARKVRADGAIAVTAGRVLMKVALASEKATKLLVAYPEA